jgi:hypothetical protein
MKRLLLLFAPALAILAAGVAFWLFWAGPGPTSEPKTIIVAQGSSLARVAGQLEEAGAIRGSSGSFRAMARVFGSSRSDSGGRIPDSGGPQCGWRAEPAAAWPAGAADGHHPRGHAFGAGP